MDKFKRKSSSEVTKLDFYDDNAIKGKKRKRDKRTFHQLSRSRLKQELLNEIEEMDVI